MKKFTIPADFILDNISRIQELNDSNSDTKVVESYGQLTEGGFNSGRSVDTLPQVNFKGLEKYVKKLNESGIEFNYTLNQACSGNSEFTKENMKKTTALIQNLWDIGIKNLTITLPPLMELVRYHKPEMNIKASAICEINSASKALYYKKIGVNRIVADTDITRKFDTIESICRAFGDGVEIIVTNMCHNYCPYKMFHYNHTSHKNNLTDNNAEADYYDNRCFLQYADKSNSAMRLNWIRPEDLNLYTNIGVSHFKLDGRDHILKGDYIKTIYHYFTESFDGNLFNLLYFFHDTDLQMRYLDNRSLDGFIKRFYENPHMCNGICDDCGYCDTYCDKNANHKISNRACYITAKNLRMLDGYNLAMMDVKREDADINML